MHIEALYQIYQQHPSVQTDTRRLKSGDIYFALKGPNFNGNAFAQQALEAGASYAVIDEASYAINDQTILVDDVLLTLQQLALHHRIQFDIPVLAITGSNGKTTTKELIHAVLSTTFNTHTTEGNLNNHIGVPLTLLKMKKDTQIAVIEMGANHQQEIASYCQIARPTHGLITNVGKAHLEGFGGEEGVRKGKGELFDFIRSSHGAVFLCSDYAYLKEMSSGIENKFVYGTHEGDVVGKAQTGSHFLQVQFIKGLSKTIETKLVGEYNLPNVLAAAAVGKYFGIDEEKIAVAIEAYTPSNSRSQLLQKGSNRIVLDAYNANPSSMKAAIENFAKMPGNKVLVLGAMAELGEESNGEHEALVKAIEQHSWKEVLLAGKGFEPFASSFHYFDTADAAGKWMKDKFNDSLLLIKGSRSMKMETVLDYL